MSEENQTKSLSQAELAKQFLEKKKQGNLDGKGGSFGAAGGGGKLQSQNNKKPNNQRRRTGGS